MRQLLLLLMICVFSCKKTIDIASPHVPQLVIHGYVPVGERFTLTVAKTISEQIPDSLLPVKNAWVALYENDNFIDSLLYSPQQKKYIARQAIAAYGKTYTIKAGAPGFPVAEATASAPDPVPTVSISHTKKARLDESGQFLDDVQFSIQDPAGVKNYYLAALYPSDYFTSSLLCVYSTDAAIDRPQADVLPSNENVCIDAKSILFNDQSFNGNLKKITISAWPAALESIRDNSGGMHKPYLKRSTVSEAFYKYIKYINSEDIEVGLPYFNVPATKIGNVTNGYGLFTIYSETTDSLP